MKFDRKRWLGIFLMGTGIGCIALALYPILLNLLALIIGIILIFRGMNVYGVSFARWQTQAMMWAMRQR